MMTCCLGIYKDFYSIIPIGHSDYRKITFIIDVTDETEFKT